MRKRWFWVILLAAGLLLMQTALAYDTLEKGDTGSDVARLQQALDSLGYTLVSDGNYGTQTRNAVREFQRDQNLKVDGKAGDETLTRLYALAGGAQESVQTDTTTPATPSADQTARVYCANGGKLNLRTGAGTGYRKIYQIPNGATVTVLSRGSQWCHVSYAGETGYVMTSFLRFSDAAVTLQPSQGAVRAVVVCDDGGKLNLRASASVNAKVLLRIPNGTELSVTVENSKWCRTSYNGESGYVMSSFLDFTPAAATETPPSAQAPENTATPANPPTQAPSGYNAVVETQDRGKLNLRRSASANAKVLLQIPYGAQLNVTRVNDQWCAVSYNGKSGYVMSKYLRFTTAVPTVPPVTNAPAYTGEATVYCADGGKLNLRTGPSTNYRIDRQIPTGTVITVLERGTTWSRVRYGTSEGYVMNSYLIFSAATATVAPPTVTPAAPTPTANVADPNATLHYGEFRYATVQSKSGSLNLRKGPGTDYAKIREIPDGTRVVVSGIEGDWCSIYYSDYSGYVAREYLVIEAPSGSDAPGTQYDTSSLTRTLREGYTGADVELVQQRLVELGYLSSAGGVYNSATMDAVRAFQRLHGLTVDGLAGNNTFALLFSDGAFPYTPDAGNYTSYVIDYRNDASAERTAAITRAQQALKALGYYVKVNGAFDEDTHDAIVAFQLRNGITASGVLDAATQSRLYSGSAHDVAWPARYYLEDGAGQATVTPTNITLKHWANEVKGMLSGVSTLTAYDPETGLQWSLSILSRGRHLDVQPTALRDTLIMRKSFGSTSWDIHIVYILLPDNSWCMAAMHNRPHYVNTIMNNGFGGQNCVHFLRDMSEAQANDPSYGVRNQEALREAWKELTGETITK